MSDSNQVRTTFFYKDNGQISSIRTTKGTLHNGVSHTVYVDDSSKGGVTIRSNGFSCRFNNRGQSLGNSFTGIKKFT